MPSAVFFTILDSVDSTNNYAMQQVRAGLATHGMAWFAREQKAGKGQRGKSWETQPGKNIALSIALEPVELPATQQFYLSMAVALGCYDFFNHYAGNDTMIKWPNDLYWRDRKAGGILIETIYHGRELKWVVVGIGININQEDFDNDLKNPVSLKQVTGEDHDVVELAKELHHIILKKINALYDKADELLKEYNQHLYKLNEKVMLKKGELIFEAVIREVNATGQLIITGSDKNELDFGEVEWILPG